MSSRYVILLVLAATLHLSLAGCREPRTSADDHPLGFAKLRLQNVAVNGRQVALQEAGPLTYRFDLPDYSIFVTPVVIRRSRVHFLFRAPTGQPIFVHSVSLARIEEGRMTSATIAGWLDYLELPLEQHGWPATPTLEVYARFRVGSSGKFYRGGFTLVRRDPKTLRPLSTYGVKFRGLEGQERHGVPDWSIDWWHRWRVKIRNGTVLSQVF